MLKILVVFALILMIIPAIAAEDATVDDEAAAESDDVVLSESGADDSSETSSDTDDEIEADEEAELEEGEAAGEPVAVEALVPAPSGFLMDLPAADVAVKVTPEYQTAEAGDLVVWAASFVNFGPDAAENPVGQVSLLEGNVAFVDAFATYINPLMGMTEAVPVPDELLALAFDPVTGIFDLSDLFLDGTMAPGDVVTLYIIGQALDDGEAILGAAISSSTYDPDLSNNVDFGFVNYAGESAAAAEETLPATGNPIAMALLALISIVGLTFGRRL
jgi:hypothetical protein